MPVRWWAGLAAGDRRRLTLSCQNKAVAAKLAAAGHLRRMQEAEAPGASGEASATRPCRRVRVAGRREPSEGRGRQRSALQSALPSRFRYGAVDPLCRAQSSSARKTGSMQPRHGAFHTVASRLYGSHDGEGGGRPDPSSERRSGRGGRQWRSILPGFRMPFGSRPSLIVRIMSMATGPFAAGSRSRFSRPMPCSAEIEP
jgi:hypothetical protein